MEHQISIQDLAALNTRTFLKYATYSQWRRDYGGQEYGHEYGSPLLPFVSFCIWTFFFMAKKSFSLLKKTHYVTLFVKLYCLLRFGPSDV